MNITTARQTQLRAVYWNPSKCHLPTAADSPNPSAREIGYSFGSEVCRLSRRLLETRDSDRVIVVGISEDDEWSGSVADGGSSARGGDRLGGGGWRGWGEIVVTSRRPWRREQRLYGGEVRVRRQGGLRPRRCALVHDSRSVYQGRGGSVAEWLACWTQAQKARVQIAAATLSGNSLKQTAHTHCASVHKAAKLVADLLRVAGVTAGQAESNGSLPSGLWLTSPAGWLPRTGISSFGSRVWANFTDSTVRPSLHYHHRNVWIFHIETLPT